MSDNLNNCTLSYEIAEPDIDKVQAQLRLLLNDRPLRVILGEDFIKRLDEWDQAITKRRTEPFSLVVLGDFKRGKSTIINAILGQALAPVNVAPETFTINSIGYSEVPSAEAVLKNGTKIKLTSDDLVRDKLEKLMRAFPSSLDYIDIRDNVEILKEIRIVDTPGLSDLDCLDKQVQEYLVNADAVIYVASALSPFSESEQLFIASHIRPQSFSKLFVLVNMIDAMNTEDDINKIIARIKERCDDIIPNTHVYGISAIDEYRRKIGLNRPDIKGFQEIYENEFLKFEVALKREIILQKDVIRTQRVLTMLNLMIKDTSARIHMVHDMIDLDSKRLDMLSEGLEDECATLAAALETQKPKIKLLIAEMQQQAEQWMYAFFSKLRENILESRTAATPEDLEKYFYSYLVDKVGEAYRRCLDLHRNIMMTSIQKMGKELSNKLGITSFAGTDDVVVSEDSMDMLNMLVSQSVMNAASAGMSNEFPSGVMPFLGNILKRKRTTDIVDIALENYDDIRNNTVKDLKEAYKDMEETALKHLNSIYETQVEVSREAINQAMEIASSSGNVMIKKHLENAATIINNCANILRKYS